MSQLVLLGLIAVAMVASWLAIEAHKIYTIASVAQVPLLQFEVMEAYSMTRISPQAYNAAGRAEVLG